jgi:hypothetical protein
MSAGFAALTENVARFGQGHMTWAALARESQRIAQDNTRQLAADDEANRQRLAQGAEVRRENALAAAAILGAMPINQQPQTIYVRPCTVYGQIAHVC